MLHSISRKKAIRANQKDRISKLRFYGDQFVFDTVSGRFHRLSPMAGFILKALIEGRNPDELGEMVETRFGIARMKAARDVELFLSEVRALELIKIPGY